MSIFDDSLSYKPFKYPWAVEAAKRHTIDMFWDVHQIELSQDIMQYTSKGGLETKNVTHEQNKSTLERNLCLFTELDKAVGEGYTKLLPHVKNNEIRNLLITQVNREVTHQRAYALANESFGFPDSSWLAFKDYVEMQGKLDLLNKPINDLHKPINFAAQLTRILLGEGISLFGAFVSLLNLKRCGLLIGFNDVNRWSLLDEVEHITNNMRIVRTIVEQDLTDKEVEELEEFTLALIEEFKQAEYKYIELLFKGAPQERLTEEDFKGYIDHICEERKKGLGLDYLELENPLPWMDYMISGETHENFFEKRVTAYNHEPLKGEVSYDKYKSMLEERLYN